MRRNERNPDSMTCNGGFTADFHRQEPCIPWTSICKLWLNWELGLGRVGRTAQISNPVNRHHRHCFDWMKLVFVSGILLYFFTRARYVGLECYFLLGRDSRTGLSPTLVSSSHAINLVTLFFCSLLLALSPSWCLKPRQCCSVSVKYQCYIGVTGCSALQELPHGVDPGSSEWPPACSPLGSVQQLLWR